MYQSSERSPAVYILASHPNGTLYIGVTSDLFGRMCAHHEGTFEGFTKKYNVKQLVYHETHFTMDEAIEGEGQLKKWRRLWKIRLIEQMNPSWSDLFDDGFGIHPHGVGGQVKTEIGDRIH